MGKENEEVDRAMQRKLAQAEVRCAADRELAAKVQADTERVITEMRRIHATELNSTVKQFSEVLRERNEEIQRMQRECEELQRSRTQADDVWVQVCARAEGDLQTARADLARERQLAAKAQVDGELSMARLRQAHADEFSRCLTEYSEALGEVEKARLEAHCARERAEMQRDSADKVWQQKLAGILSAVREQQRRDQEQSLGVHANSTGNSMAAACIEALAQRNANLKQTWRELDEAECCWGNAEKAWRQRLAEVKADLNAAREATTDTKSETTVSQMLVTPSKDACPMCSPRVLRHSPRSMIQHPTQAQSLSPAVGRRCQVRADQVVCKSCQQNGHEVNVVRLLPRSSVCIACGAEIAGSGHAGRQSFCTVSLNRPPAYPKPNHGSPILSSRAEPNCQSMPLLRTSLQQPSRPRTTIAVVMPPQASCVGSPGYLGGVGGSPQVEGHGSRGGRSVVLQSPPQTSRKPVCSAVVLPQGSVGVGGSPCVLSGDRGRHAVKSICMCGLPLQMETQPSVYVADVSPSVSCASAPWLPECCHTSRGEGLGRSPVSSGAQPASCSPCGTWSAADCSAAHAGGSPRAVRAKAVTRSISGITAASAVALGSAVASVAVQGSAATMAAVVQQRDLTPPRFPRSQLTQDAASPKVSLLASPRVGPRLLQPRSPALHTRGDVGPLGI